MPRIFIQICLFTSILFLSSYSYAVQITYNGHIGDPYGTVFGTVDGYSWITSDASGSDFWSFTGTAGESVDIWGTRLQGGLDLAFSLYQGTTTADESLFSVFKSFGGMEYLTYGDDDWGPVLNGPYKDPALYSFMLPVTGDYTIAIGGFISESMEPYQYLLSVGAPGTAPSPVPVPAAFWLFATGLLGLIGLYKRK